MSTIGVKYHNEDVHNIIPKPMPPIIKSPRYSSKQKFLLKSEQILKYNGHQTFGLAHYEAPQSWNFLKKGKHKIEPINFLDKTKFKGKSYEHKTSSLPKCSFSNTKQANKDYVKENIKKITEIMPKTPLPRRVETPRGTVRDMAHLLQMIKIRKSEEYGRIPKYLCKRRKQWAEEKKRIEQEEQAIKEYKRKLGIGTMGMPENVYMIDKETRQKLLDGLKENWNELSKQFLKLPVMSDTLPKIKRKMWLEREIDQLEKDVKLVESHPYIYLERFDSKLIKEMALQKSEQEKIDNKKNENEKTKNGHDNRNCDCHAPDKNGPVDQAPEDKKEEDKEINIFNY